MILRDVRVVDLSGGIAGAYLSRLFADAGADVIRVESEAGAELRRRSAVPVAEGDNGPLFSFLAAGTRSVSGALGEDATEELLASADLIVVDDTLTPTAVAGIEARHRSGVITSIRPYGLKGPWAERSLNEFLVQADTGSISCRGHVSLPPYMAGGDVFEWMAACYAAPPSLAAIDRARRCGRGEVVDVSMAESTALAASTFADLSQQMSGRTELPTRSIETPSIERARDGWVGFNTNTRQQFQGFCLMIERPDLMDSEWGDLRTRTARLDEWSAIVNEWMAEHSVAEIVELASELRVPVARVNDGAGVLSEEHLVARGFFATTAEGFRAPRSPRKIDGERSPIPGPAPAIGEHTGQIEPRGGPEPAAVGTVSSGSGGSPDGAVMGAVASEPRGGPESVGAASSSDPDARPLAGVRVVDLTSWWAGPCATQAMAALGADVIHVESVSHPDGMRLTGMMFGKERWWEWGHMFLAANHDKRALTLDLNDPRGRELLLLLVDGADVVVENFSPRVIEAFGLGWEELRARNPRLVMVRMPAFGLDGPWRERVGFAQTMEQMSGMAWLTGHEADQPRIPRGPCDPIAGMHGCFAALLGLRKRNATGQGVFIESAMVEGAINCAAELIVEYSANGVRLNRLGNRSRFAAPQGIYETAEPEQWLAISCDSDEAWSALAGVIGVDAADLATLEDRQAAHDELDQHLSRWAARRSLEAAVDELARAGVPAVACRNHATLRFHPQFEARGFYELVEHREVGTHYMPAQPYRMRGIERWITNATPTLGQHNHEILTELGLSASEIASLEESGVIGTVPVL